MMVTSFEGMTGISKKMSSLVSDICLFRDITSISVMARAVSGKNTHILFRNPIIRVRVDDSVTDEVNLN